MANMGNQLYLGAGQGPNAPISNLGAQPDQIWTQTRPTHTHNGGNEAQMSKEQAEEDGILSHSRYMPRGGVQKEQAHKIPVQGDSEAQQQAKKQVTQAKSW